MSVGEEWGIAGEYTDASYDLETRSSGHLSGMAP